jgi:hypothetical protein
MIAFLGVDFFSFVELALRARSFFLDEELSSGVMFMYISCN